MEETLDPGDWEEFRRTAYRIVDDAIGYTATVRDRPVWQAMPEAVRASFQRALPQGPRPLDEVYADLTETMLPYPMGNIHPRFWMWYMGSSNVTGALGDFLAAILGSNLVGGNHAAALIDDQVVDWLRQMIGLPEGASGTLVSGGSMANLLGLTVARNIAAGIDVREMGVAAIPVPLRFYGSDQIHGCHQKAVESLGLGNRALRRIPSKTDCSMDVAALEAAIAEDRAAGWKPACVIATAGTVNTGAIDDLPAIAALCRKEGIRMHVDGCIGALLAIAPEHRHLVRGLAEADSVALDPHKWLHAPFEVGCILVRDPKEHLRTFTLTPEYLQQAERGVAAGSWLSDYGLQTSRGFRALKVWMSLQEHGVEKFGRLIDQNITQAKHLAELIYAEPLLELVAPVVVNIVCFRFNPGGMDDRDLKRLNTEIMLRLQESGLAAVSDTTVRGAHCLRAAIANHRTRVEDLDLLVREVVATGRAVWGKQGRSNQNGREAELAPPS